ncbi:MAG: molybdopterin-dependent oxidoreductase [Chloroflexi bacterium]|nr:molybdopterin-dependent oxidoreductase [Chloroflexota bacterium]MBU1749262.1 molybdopterin-dependent oxidoreductase [Chloroflexota bacterium]
MTTVLAEPTRRQAIPIPTGCAHNCSGSCALIAHVRDGRIVQITTDERPDRPNDPQLRACLRGRAYRRRVYHPDRLLHPLRRTGPRGEGRFERITWDEALDTVAGELRRVIDTYGNAAVYLQHGSGGLAQLMGMEPAGRLLNCLGGHLEGYGSYSAACIEATVPITLGTRVCAHPPTDWHNARLILLWGHNPAETTFGTNTPYHLRRVREAGTRIVVIDPRHTPTAVALADEWIPIRPGTDVALISALAYVLITEGLNDQAFLDRCCLGFDEAHLPPGIPAGEAYRAYVLGEADAVPKTPAWAEPITRIPAERIARLARELAAAKPMALMPGYAPQRRAYGEQFVRACIALAALTGNIGVPGGSSGAPGTPPQFTPMIGLGAGPNLVPYRIPTFRWTDALADSAALTPRDGLRGGDRLPSDVKLVYNVASNVLVNQHADCRRTADLLRDPAHVEFIAVQDQFLTPSARFADVVLPVVTWLEMSTVYQLEPQGNAVVAMNQAIAPLGECRSDYAICAALADRLGVGEAYRAGRTEADWLREAVRSVQAQDPACPDYETLREQGIYTVRWDPPIVPFEDFRADPAAHPLDTPSGKIELFSTVLWDWGDPARVPAVPRYIPEPDDGPRYPLQLLGPHTFRRTHSTLEEVDWLEEAFPHHVALNPADAAARGIADGDRVRVFNDRGAIVLRCRVTPLVMPGVVVVPQGAWWAPDADGVDTRGCVNVLTSQRATPWAGGSTQHSAWVEVEREAWSA